MKRQENPEFIPSRWNSTRNSLTLCQRQTQEELASLDIGGVGTPMFFGVRRGAAAAAAKTTRSSRGSETLFSGTECQRPNHQKKKNWFVENERNNDHIFRRI